MDGEPINAVSARAGHSSVSITLDVYGHVMPDNQKGLATRYEDDLLEAIREHDGNKI
jgi:integrase